MAAVDERFRAMGGEAHVVVVGGPPRLGAAARAHIEHLEARWSRFRATSDVSLINVAAGEPVCVAPETVDIVGCAVDAWEATGGAFDPTVLRAVEQAGYDRSFEHIVDGETSVEGPSDVPGCAGIEVDVASGTVAVPRGVALDLGGIGKGRAADLVAERLLGAGAEGALVNLGGDLRVVGEAPTTDGWIVGVDDEVRGGELTRLVLSDGGVATTSRLQRSWRRGGVEAHHVIDPSSGAPSTSDLATVTVVAGQAWWAEVLATAAFVHGYPAALADLALAGVTGLLVERDGAVHRLPGLEVFVA